MKAWGKTEKYCVYRKTICGHGGGEAITEKVCEKRHGRKRWDMNIERAEEQW